MNDSRTRFGFALIFSAALVTSLGVAACSPEASGAALGDADDSDGDLEATFGTPNDDPDLDDAEGLESPEEAAVDDGLDLDDEVGANATTEAADFPVEIDVTDLVEDLTTPQAAKRVASPVTGRGVTYPYGVKSSRYAAGFHTGQDYAAPVGRAVVAVRSGKIRWSNNSGGAYGRWIGLDADNGRTYVYCHLSSRRYKAGKKVKAGERIGRVGATGNVTGPHLHFEDHPKGPFRYAQVRKPKW